MKKLIILFLLFHHSFLNAQNLVPNGSFEEYKICPSEGNMSLNGEWKQGPNSWFLPSNGNSDYYNKCSKECGIKDQKPRTGNAYAGIIVFSSELNSSREYISSVLDSLLTKDEFYCARFYVSLADYSTLECSHFGMYLSEENPIVQRGDYSNFLSYLPQVVSDGEFISNDSGWVEVSGIYKAKGGEKFITIGNFTPNEQGGGKLRKGSKLNSGAFAYYFIDDVSVIHITNEFDCIAAGKSVVLNNITFKSGKNNLLPTSFPELDKLVNSLKGNLYSNIEISGHTDNLGKEAGNVKLSKARAKAVADYLVSKGIKKDRVKYKGYGSSKPIAANDTEEGKQKNRRVEFILSGK